MLYYNAINRFAGVLDIAWNEMETNEAADTEFQGVNLDTSASSQQNDQAA